MFTWRVVFLLALISVSFAGFDYLKSFGFTLSNGEHKDAHLTRVGEPENHVDWGIYERITINFPGFTDSTVSFILEDGKDNRVQIPNIENSGSYELPVHGIIPTETCTLTIQGEQTGDTATYRNINVGHADYTRIMSRFVKNKLKVAAEGSVNSATETQ